MTEKRFTMTQNGDLFTVRDTVEKKPMGVFEFKEDEFPVFACFCMIIDKLNELSEENKKLKKEIEAGTEYCNIIETDLGKCADNRILLQKENKELKKENDALKKFVKVNFSDMMAEKMEKELKND